MNIKGHHEHSKNRQCRRLGHKFPTGAWGNALPYGRINEFAIDGLGTHHAYIELQCDRCDERLIVCAIHLPKQEKKMKKTYILIDGEHGTEYDERDMTLEELENAQHVVKVATDGNLYWAEK